jgi:3-oxoacyl-[acyl-carrier protein] reductase
VDSVDLGIRGRVAVVAAASDGLGLASALTLAAEGVDVVVTGRRADKLDAAVAAIKEATGREALGVVGDIDAVDEPARVVDLAVSRFGGVDILVTNSGGPPARRALDVSDEEVVAAVNSNLLSAVRLIRAARPHLGVGGDGRICCITSVSVVQPIPGLALSNLARAGLWAWAKTAAQDLRPEGITLNLICPGLHRTARMVNVGIEGEAGRASDFGQAVAFLCSAAARFITATTLVVDGGETAGL